MKAAGFVLFTLGYAMTWTGVQRFRGTDVSLIDALGFSGGQTTKVGGTSSKAKPDLLHNVINFATEGPAIGAIKSLGF